jgi:hypothetical protein
MWMEKEGTKLDCGSARRVEVLISGECERSFEKVDYDGEARGEGFDES